MTTCPYCDDIRVNKIPMYAHPERVQYRLNCRCGFASYSSSPQTKKWNLKKNWERYLRWLEKNQKK